MTTKPIAAPAPPEESGPQHEFVVNMSERVEQAHKALKQHNLKVWQSDPEEPLLFAPGYMMWLENKRRQRGDSSKLQQKFAKPYQVIEAYDNHTYKIKRQRQISVQTDVSLTLHYLCPAKPGIAPTNF